MSLIGKDRPGLVQLVAGVVTSHDGNWLESRMAHLGGHFAGMLRVTVPEERKEEFLRNVRSLESRGLTAVVHEDEAEPASQGARSAELRLVGQDRPGIVRQISEAFHRHGINVEELSTECASAPMSGEILFQAEARIQIPATCDMPALQKEFERIGTDLMVEIKIDELTK